MEKLNRGLRSDIMTKIGRFHWEPRKLPRNFARPQTHGVTAEIVADQLYQTFGTGEAMSRRVSEMRTQEGVPEQ